MSLTGKVALVTGGSRGIGRAAALELARQGADVAVIYAGNEEKAAQTAEEICALGRTARAYRCDVADFQAAKETVAQVKKDFGTVDILVNNAGITRDGLLAMMSEEAFDAVVDTNLKGAFNFIRHCTPIFIRNRGGVIVNVSSVAGLMGNAGQANYASSKAGLIGLTKSVARELAGRGVRCNAVAPGFIATDMTQGVTQDNPLVDAIPLGRVGAPEDVARTVAFLASDAAGYITGEVLRVDGGMAM